MKKKIVLSIAFVLSLLPMLLKQYGGMKGVQEITGLMNLYNPIGMVSIILFIVGVWGIKNKKISKFIGAVGTIGIVVSEIYNFLFWHMETITGKFALQHSIRFAFPEFYFGLVVSVIMIIFYLMLDRIVKEQ